VKLPRTDAKPVVREHGKGSSPESGQADRHGAAGEAPHLAIWP
jgi:hypothetical protein